VYPVFSKINSRGIPEGAIITKIEAKKVSRTNIKEVLSARSSKI
jgi:hypothetical protein